MIRASWSLYVTGRSRHHLENAFTSREIAVEMIVGGYPQWRFSRS
jgi:hypothetical protein